MWDVFHCFKSLALQLFDINRAVDSEFDVDGDGDGDGSSSLHESPP